MVQATITTEEKVSRLHDQACRMWQPPRKISPSEWAARHRVLTRRQSARTGPWRNANSPHLIGLMDLCANRGIEELNIMKAGQVGASEAVRNVLGWIAHCEPDPVLLVLPNEKTGKKIVGKRIIPLFEDTPCLRELLTAQSRDVQLTQITLTNGFQLSLGWSGSPATLASDPIRVVINDEVDKFELWSGREADPISLAYVRTKTYEDRRLIINISTPTTRNGVITERFESCGIKLYYFVPCPHCGTYQRLTFDRVRYEKFGAETDDIEADLIEENRAAWYECRHCSERITDLQKPKMVRQGVWATECQEIDADGTVHGEWPQSKRVGIHLSGLYPLWERFYEHAAEFVRSKSDPKKLMNFRNSWCGEPFEQRITRTKASVFEDKCKNAPPAGVVPKWAAALLATVDVQKDHFYFVIRAWGVNSRSQRVQHGILQTFEEVRQVCVDGVYQFEDKSAAPLRCSMLGIDSGYRTDEVYRFALTDPTRMKPLKGDKPIPHPSGMRVSQVTYSPPDRRRSRYQVWVHQFDACFFKDRLHGYVHQKPAEVDVDSGEVLGQQERWLLNEENDPDYNRMMASEHKVFDPKGRVEEWKPITSGAANHYWDCEVMQVVMAHISRVELLSPGQQSGTKTHRMGGRKPRGMRKWR